MSETLGSASSSRGVKKSTCRQCNRSVYVVEIDGKLYTLDPELIMTVPFERKQELVPARRLHSEMCLRYQSDAARLRTEQERKRVRKPLPGKREPGQ